MVAVPDNHRTAHGPRDLSLHAGLARGPNVAEEGLQQPEARIAGRAHAHAIGPTATSPARVSVVPSPSSRNWSIRATSSAITEANGAVVAEVIVDEAEIDFLDHAFGLHLRELAQRPDDVQRAAGGGGGERREARLDETHVRIE